MVLLKRHLAHQTDYCVLEIDEYGNEGGERMYLAHLRVLRWSPSTLRKIKHDWAVFRRAVTVPLFASPMHDDPRWVKFVTMMGWRPHSTVLSQDGITRPLYIHTVHDRQPEARKGA